MIALPPETLVTEPLIVSRPQSGYFKRLSPLYYRDRYANGRRRKPEFKDWLPVLLWFGAPIDPVTGEEMDRSHRWQCWVAGKEEEPLGQWEWCCGHPISAMQYQEMLEQVLNLPSLADLESMSNEVDNVRYDDEPDDWRTGQSSG